MKLLIIMNSFTKTNQFLFMIPKISDPYLLIYDSKLFTGCCLCISPLGYIGSGCHHTLAV